MNEELVNEYRAEVYYWAEKVQLARIHKGTGHNSPEYFERLLDQAVIDLARVLQ